MHDFNFEDADPAAATLAAVNARFNAELARQIAGMLPPGHIYQLGHPGRILLSAGIPDLPIELSASRLAQKASAGYVSQHPFKLRSIMDLPMALNGPIAVFEARNKNGATVILTELTEHGHHFIVVLKVRQSDDATRLHAVVNDIRSLYPKDRVQGIRQWVRGGLLLWVDKKKARKFISTQWPNYIGG